MWTPHPAYFPDDAFYARLCLPDGLALYWHDFGLYRLFTVLPYALLNRAVMRAALSPALLSLTAVLFATLAFVWACLRAGLPRLRGALLAGVLLGSPLLLETVNFWSGTLNYALVLLVLAAQLRASAWARRSAGEPSERLARELSGIRSGESSERPAGNSPATVTGGSSAMVTGDSSATVTGDSPERATSEAAERLADEPPERLTDKLPERLAVEPQGRVAGESSSSGLRGELARGLIVTAGGALLALLTYEIALPFVLATSALYVRGWLGRLATVCVAVVACVAIVAALAAVGLYWPQRFKLALEQLTPAASGAVTTPNATADGNNPANPTADANSPANAAADGNNPANAAADVNNSAKPAPSASPTSSAPPTSSEPPASHASSAPERARMYAALSFSFIGTGLRSPYLWALVVALAGACFLSRRRSAEVVREAARAGGLSWSVLASAFAFALVACVGYLALTRSMNARYVAFLLIYGAATLAWTKGRVACYALASLLLVQAAVAASFPVHMRDVELAARGEAAASPARSGDLVSVNGRLARASWAKRFHAPPPLDMLTQPLNSRACRYSAPCEECK